MSFKYNSYDHYYRVSQLTSFFDEVGELELIEQNQFLSYYNVAAAFDIETSSTYYKRAKFATMYIWQFGLNGVSIIGRTWTEFSQLMNAIVEHYHLSKSTRMMVFVHNLAYEFQFMRKRIAWHKHSDGTDCVFSLKKRRPIYALADCGIEFRCSYFLSNCALSYIGQKMLFKYPVQKMVGDLDYKKVRHSETPLTETELGYCLNDIRVVMSYIQEKIENEDGIINIPLTNTGYVRKFTRDYCMGKFIKDETEARRARMNYQDIMRSLQIQSSKEYYQLKSAFAGGFTHASPTKSRWGSKIDGKQLPYWVNVGSADLSSSYPYTMVSSYFPMSSGTFLGEVDDPKQFSQLINNFCCLFTLTIHDVYQIFPNESYISYSKCTQISDDAVVQNGRVCEASYLSINITELDFDIISKVYGWDSTNMRVDNMRVYDRGYLPKSFIMAVLELYAAKTTLKGVDDRIVEYMIKKGMLNSSYGMAVTDIVRDEATYCDDLWDSDPADAISQLGRYNKAFTRFLFYPWGVWVTAHARHNLWEAIFEFGDDYIYADTDSIKGLNFDKHEKFFIRYNYTVKKKVYLMCDYYGIPKSLVEPKTNKGKKKLIGVWEREEDYIKFRTIGAKRYLYEYASGKLGLTVAGVNKNYALPYLLHKFCGFDYDLCIMAYNEDPRFEKEHEEALSQLIEQHKTISYDPVFEEFDDSLEIPPGYSGKSIHTYIDVPFGAWVTDYNGVKKLCYEKSYTHLEETGYKFSMAQEYLDYLAGIVMVCE